MILVTTSDYFPKLGGITTFTRNIEFVLNELQLPFELYHWKNHRDINQFPAEKLSRYTCIINIHPQFAWLTETHHERMINFIHGSEILMTSPNIFKAIYKRFNKLKFFDKLSRSYLNVFISEATFKKAIESGLNANYSRDIIYHNCIDTSDAGFIKKDILHKIVFSCIVRNVPHKNLKGTLSFCEMVARYTGKQIELIVPKDSRLTSSVVTVTELASRECDERDEAYKRSHFNLLLSLDHSSKGQYEGFGLTVLEAGRFGTPSIVLNTGGLGEAVHHGETGWVIDAINAETVEHYFSQSELSRYTQMSVDCYKHTIRCHSLMEYIRFFKKLNEVRSSA